MEKLEQHLSGEVSWLTRRLRNIRSWAGVLSSFDEFRNPGWSTRKRGAKQKNSNCTEHIFAAIKCKTRLKSMCLSLACEHSGARSMFCGFCVETNQRGLHRAGVLYCTLVQRLQTQGIGDANRTVQSDDMIITSLPCRWTTLQLVPCALLVSQRKKSKEQKDPDAGTVLGEKENPSLPWYSTLLLTAVVCQS